MCSLSTTGISLEQDEASVSLKARGETGDEFEISARYLVGCDGANSFVRKHLAIVLEDLAFDEWWMVVDTLTSDPGKRTCQKLSIFAGRRARGRSCPAPETCGDGRSSYCRAKTRNSPARQTMLSNCSEVSPIHPHLTIWRSAVYRFHALLGESWRDHRVFLMGDAVHQTPPFLGQGLCAGIRDASNLAWKLAHVLRGSADDTLLDSYEVERKPHVRSVVASAREFGKIIGELDPAAAVARDERLRADLKSGKAETIRQKFIPDLSSGLVAARNKIGGKLFVQPRVRSADGTVRRLDDLLKPEFAVVTATQEAMSWISRAANLRWQQLGGERVIITDAGESATGDELISDRRRKRRGVFQLDARKRARRRHRAAGSLRLRRRQQCGPAEYVDRKPDRNAGWSMTAFSKRSLSGPTITPALKRHAFSVQIRRSYPALIFVKRRRYCQNGKDRFRICS